MSLSPPALLAVRLFCVFLAVACVGVALLIDRDSAALEADLGVATGTITHMYAHRIGSSSGAMEHRADVEIVTGSGGALALRVELSSDRADTLRVGDRIAVAYQRGNPANNRAGADVEALLAGSLTPQDFFARIDLAVDIAIVAGALFAVVAVASFLPGLSVARRA